MDYKVKDVAASGGRCEIECFAPDSSSQDNSYSLKITFISRF